MKDERKKVDKMFVDIMVQNKNLKDDIKKRIQNTNFSNFSDLQNLEDMKAKYDAILKKYQFRKNLHMRCIISFASQNDKQNQHISILNNQIQVQADTIDKITHNLEKSEK